MNYNALQCDVIQDICRYITNPVAVDPILILGPGGSGKSTVVAHALSLCYATMPLNVTIAAFMNKAVSAIRERTPEPLRSNATFTTLHKMLRLEPKCIDVNGKSYDTLISLDSELRATLYDYDNLFAILTHSSNEEGLQFLYDFNKTTYLQNVNVIVVDECSTKSRELWVYMQSTLRWLRSNDHHIKVIYIGDHFQLPPVGEANSVVFDIAESEGWRIRKLETVCRATVPLLTEANNRFIAWLNSDFLTRQYLRRSFVDGFPMNIIPHSRIASIYHMRSQSEWLDSIISRFIRGANPSVVCVTYSNGNAYNLNQKIVLGIAGRYNYERSVESIGGKLPDFNEARPYKNTITPYIEFRAGDRILIKNPIELVNFEISEDNLVTITGGRNEYIYNGDIYTVIAARDVNIKTILNELGVQLEEQTIPPYFRGQVLTVVDADWNYATNYDDSATYEDRRISGYVPDTTSQPIQILNLDFTAVKATYTPIRARMGFTAYCENKQSFRRYFSQVQFGYAVTVYKIQGSEAESVYVNLGSFWHSLMKNVNDKEMGTNLDLLIRAFYVAVTRARQYLSVYIGPKGLTR
jgi:hypothetical protein